MSVDLIEFRGRQVTPDWPDAIEAAQRVTSYSIGGVPFIRVRYGAESEDWGAQSRPCDDCTVVAGEFHVPGCDRERCPSCSGQAIGCDCEFENL